MRVYRNGKWVSLNSEGSVEGFSAGNSTSTGTSGVGDSSSGSSSGSSSKLWLYISLGVIAFIIVAILVWYCMKSKSSNSLEGFSYGSVDQIDNLEAIMQEL